MIATKSSLEFTLPPALEATEPPEERGKAPAMRELYIDMGFDTESEVRALLEFDEGVGGDG